MKLAIRASFRLCPNSASSASAGASLAERTSLGIGGTTDLLLIRRHAALPDLIALLREAGVPYRFLGGGTNLLVQDGELPWVVLQLARQEPDVRLEGNLALRRCGRRPWPHGHLLRQARSRRHGGADRCPRDHRRRVAHERRRLRHADRHPTSERWNFTARPTRESKRCRKMKFPSNIVTLHLRPMILCSR